MSVKKITKQSAGYRPSKGPKKCGNCDMYRAGSCTLVEGLIKASDVCKFWEKK